MFKIKMTEIRVLDKEYSWKGMTLLEFLVEGNIPTEWADFFAKPEVWEELKSISNKLAKETRTIYPSIQNVFRALYLVPPEKIKVVMPGGELFIEMAEGGWVFMTGPVEKVYEGKMELGE